MCNSFFGPTCTDGVVCVGKAVKVELDLSSQIYRDVEQLVVGTFQSQLVGLGNDAVGLSHSGIAVNKIWRVENAKLYHKYRVKVKELCQAAVTQPYPPINGLSGEVEVTTRTLSEMHIFYLFIYLQTS